MKSMLCRLQENMSDALYAKSTSEQFVLYFIEMFYVKIGLGVLFVHGIFTENICFHVQYLTVLYVVIVKKQLRFYV